MTKEEAIKKVIDLAEEQVGYVPYNGKKNKYAEELDEVDFFNGKKNGYDWCCCFVCWLFEHLWGKATAQKMLYLPEKSLAAACPYAANYYINNKAWHAVPEVGDQIFFGDRYDEDHTGIVWKVTNNYVYTIEGNAGGGNGKVMKRQYALTNGWISGYGRPNWSVVVSADPVPTPAPEPKPEVPKIIEEDGIFGPLSTKALQKWLGLDQTGRIPGQDKALAKYFPAITSCTWEDDGSVTVKYFQRYLTQRGYGPGPADGYLGPNTVKAWRKWLKVNQWFDITEGSVFDEKAAWCMQRFLNIVLGRGEKAAFK